jgi:hypothetical protein
VDRNRRNPHAGVEPMSDEEINAEVKAAGAERRARNKQ